MDLAIVKCWLLGYGVGMGYGGLGSWWWGGVRGWW
jgi:hypothetical protein